MRHVPPATKVYKQAYPVTEGAECARTDAIKLLTFLSLITKLPLAPKREFLAIPQGWRHKLQPKKKTPA